jgi:hypothetical protein
MQEIARGQSPQVVNNAVCQLDMEVGDQLRIQKKKRP